MEYTRGKDLTEYEALVALHERRPIDHSFADSKPIWMKEGRLFRGNTYDLASIHVGFEPLTFLRFHGHFFEALPVTPKTASITRAELDEMQARLDEFKRRCD